MSKARSDTSTDDASPRDVATWMLDELRSSGRIYQSEIAYDIVERFGNDFCYEKENGNLAIDRKVLSEFRALTEGTAVWERGERAWRWREPTDGEGRQAD